MPGSPVEAVVPSIDTLPGGAVAWAEVDEAVVVAGGGGSDVVELLDCVGDDFPHDEVAATAVSPHFVQLPRRLVHGIGVEFTTTDAADRATAILSARPFAECLGRSVAADFGASGPSAELLAMDVTATGVGQRVSFTGADAHGVRPVHLDLALVRIEASIGLLWFGDTPDPFPEAVVADVVGRILERAGRD